MKIKLNSVVMIFALLYILAIIGDSETINGTATGFQEGHYLSHDDKSALLRYSYSTLDSHFDSYSRVNKCEVADDALRSFSYDRLFITFYNEGKLRACQSGSTKKEEKGIVTDIEEAISKCIKDERYGGALKEEEVPNIEIVFTFLFNRTPLKTNSIKQLEKKIELGVNAIEVENNGKRSFFVESVPIKENIGLKQTLEKLCVKAHLSNTCYKDKNTHIYKYDTYTFKGNRAGDITDLYRYNTLVDTEYITQEGLKDSITLAQGWYLNNINPKTSLVEYEYYPAKGQYSKSDNHVRRLGSVWAMAEIQKFLKDDSLGPIINDSLTYYLKYECQKEGYRFIAIDGKTPLAYDAFLILALLNIEEYPDKDSLVKGLADGILAAQRNDGSYYTDIMHKNEDQKDFYPGEAMLALMKAFDETNDPRYLSSVQRAFVYYRDYWRGHKNTAFVPWHTQADYLLYNSTKDKEIAEFIFEMNDWLIDNYQIVDSRYPDEIGGMPPGDPRCATSSYMEGINDAYSLAKILGDKNHEDKYRESLRLGMRFILQTQYNAKNTFFIVNPDNAIGGFRQSLTENSIRNDYVQHAITSLIKASDNHLFERSDRSSYD